MLSRRTPLVLLGLLAIGAAGYPGSAQESALLDDYWAADTASERKDVAKRIAAATHDFDRVLAEFERGPRLGDAPTGKLLRNHDIDGVRHPYMLLVPDSYDPERTYPVRVYLHGGVSRADIPARGGWWRNPDRVADDDAIAVIPAGWGRSMWWQRSQLRNMRAILAELRRTYNVDTNQVHALGISDGGTGAWYFAFLDPTPWASFVPLIGHPAVLAAPSVAAQGQMHVANLRNRPFLAINGGLDRLYPTRSVLPYVELFRDSGIEIDFVNQADHGHTVEWWPQEAERIDSFMLSNPRLPLPPSLVFETADAGEFGRLHWLEISELGITADDVDMPVYERPLHDLPNSRMVGFPHPLASGRVEATAEGNTITMRSRGVRRVRLLLSPRQFDFSAPIRVVANGSLRFEQTVAGDVAALLTYAAEDLDRSMPFGSVIEIDLGARPSS
ncbi:MAG: hypothetical protein GKS06_01085 [Acidobacteria bacterium]|nr:hypothetical protein [Acidobacteriota bacterium]